MERIEAILPGLVERAGAQRNGSLLFAFRHGALRASGIFFGRSRTMLIAVMDRQAAWQCDVSQGTLSEWIPSDAYRLIQETLMVDGARSNKEFFIRLRAALEAVCKGELGSAATDDEIIRSLRACRTSDAKYDKEGDRPFFHHWRRVRPSAAQLAKIQRYFGRSIREDCYRNGVTGVWSSEPHADSLGFLDPEAVAQGIADLAPRRSVGRRFR